MNNVTLFGIDRLIADAGLMGRLREASVALVANPASVTLGREHSVDALVRERCRLTRAFGPQHGMRGDKQDNMIESDDYIDPVHGIPVISLYGDHRRPTDEMLEGVDIVLFDLQDVGCRIYTYITTLKYFLEACTRLGIELWVLDRPNPAGRPVDGLRLEPGEESFVGCDELPTRHGLTVGELGRWMQSKHKMSLPLRIVEMENYEPDEPPGYGWPVFRRQWINPSPNASTVNMARCFGGTVLLEGTELSEGRGTTTPLELIGCPGFPADEVLANLVSQMPHWATGAYLRRCYFEPTFHKHKGELCEGLQIHTDYAEYRHELFLPYRLVAGLLKSYRQLAPEAPLWRRHAYEYELDRIPIDVINGGPYLRQWVDDDAAGFDAMEARIEEELNAWIDERDASLIYR